MSKMDDGPIRVTIDRYEAQGRRPYMEDQSRVQMDPSTHTLAAVICDGHGSAILARWVVDRAVVLILRILNRYHYRFASGFFRRNFLCACLEADVKRVLVYLERMAYRTFDGSSIVGGCTLIAVGCIPDFQLLVTANVGDSRLWMGGNETSNGFATLDHKPLHPDEWSRIQRGRGWISRDARVNGVLALSRAFGDWSLKRHPRTSPNRTERSIHFLDGPVSCMPDVHVLPFCPQEMPWIVLGSDGIWDVLSHAEMRKFLSIPSHDRNRAKDLVQAAYRRGSTDNMTAIVLFFSRLD